MSAPWAPGSAAHASFKCASLWENWGQSQKLKKKLLIWANKTFSNCKFLKLEYLLLWPMVDLHLKVA